MLVIFDWDGTLVDSRAEIVAAMQAAMRDAKLPVLEEDTIANIIGLGLSEAIATLYPDTPLNDQQRAALIERYGHHFVAISSAPGGTAFFPHVEDTLGGLLDAGHQLAVATGKSRRGLDRALKQKGLQAYFVATACADETASKPDPLMLLRLLASTGVAVQDAVMIGDTSYDMAMAQALSMPRIGVSYGVHATDVLSAYEPLRIIDCCSELQREPLLQL